MSALLYTPRDSYTSDLRTRAHKMLADAYGGRASAYYPSFGDGPLARVHLIIGLSPGHPEPDEDSSLGRKARSIASSPGDAGAADTTR